MIKITNKPKQYLVLGSGGTGSWLASFLSKTTQKVVFMDGDIVEHKNTLRQNFVESDVNKNKAQVIGERYQFPFITEFLNSAEMLTEILDSIADNATPVIIGCLDNNATRKIVHDIFENPAIKDIIWVDAGNAERHGQVYVAVKENSEVIFPSPLKVDTVFANFEGDERRPDQISCAEQSQSAPQNVTANVTSATCLFNIIQVIDESGILLGNKLSWNAVTMTFTTENKLEELS